MIQLVPETDTYHGATFYPYSQETEAYNDMWQRSHDSETGEFTQEAACVFTSNGILVLPNEGDINGTYYSNSYNSGDYAAAWFNTYGDDVGLIGTMHTHPESCEWTSALEDDIWGMFTLIMCDNTIGIKFDYNGKTVFANSNNYPNNVSYSSNVPNANQVRNGDALY